MSDLCNNFDKDGEEGSDESLSEILQKLERLGLARRNGEYRNGRPVYVSTEIDELLN